MRAAVLAIALLVPTTAAAGPFHAARSVPGSPFRDVVMHPPKRASSGVAGFANVSNVLYLNPCLPDGCTVRPGFDDSREDTSSIASSPATLLAYPHGESHWNELVKCVRDLYAPFNIQITDVDPGNVPHFEVMIAGSASALGVDGAGGVAPFVPCDGELQDNALSFVFAADIENLDFLCWAAAQESAHTFGLDHELNAKDPMTYLAPPYRKEGFQNVDAKCGEDASDPRECFCGGTTQNSWQHLMDVFGPAQLEPASLTITRPADGAWVKPGFTVRAELVSQLSLTSGILQVDGATAQSIKKGDPLVWNTSSTLPGGEHTVTIVATDTADRSLAAPPITVHVTERCGDDGSCAEGTHCLGGYCLPGAKVAGGLGAPCTGGEQCITETCGSDGSTMLCTGACDAGFSCPAGFACVMTGDSGVCWPDTDGGGCAATGGDQPLCALLGLGALLVLVRRRR